MQRQENHATARQHQGPENKQAESYRLPDDWRNRLPDPGEYFSDRIGKLSKASNRGWATGCCPFHEDRNPSFGANLNHGGWICRAGCGSGNLMAFHMRFTGLEFKDAVLDLMRIAGRMPDKLPARDAPRRRPRERVSLLTTLKAIDHEALLVSVIAADVYQHREIDDSTMARLA